MRLTCMDRPSTRSSLSLDEIGSQLAGRTILTLSRPSFFVRDFS